MTVKVVNKESGDILATIRYVKDISHRTETIMHETGETFRGATLYPMRDPETGRYMNQQYTVDMDKYDLVVTYEG